MKKLIWSERNLMNNLECKHGRNRFLVGALTVITLIALFLHLASHLIPILITNEAFYKAIEPFLHHPLLIIAAWSFLPLACYHTWKDRKIHTEMHRLQKENQELRDKIEQDLREPT
jgi:succinate dehydrogenase hydrophobic anchor subunit